MFAVIVGAARAIDSQSRCIEAITILCPDRARSQHGGIGGGAPDRPRGWRGAINWLIAT
jgi:hypothetical protein